MSYPAGTPYEPQTEEERDDFPDAHPQDVEGGVAEAISAQAVPTGLEQLQIEDLVQGVNEDDPEEERLNPRGHAEDRHQRGQIEHAETPSHSFGRAEP